MHKKILASCVSAVCAVALAAGPAHADSKAVDDRRGDAVAGIDIVGWKAANGANSVKVAVQFASLRKTRLTVLNVAIKVDGKIYDAYLDQRADGTFKRYLRVDDERNVRCGGLGFAFAPDTVQLTVPQRCLNDNDQSIKVWMQAYSNSRGEDPPNYDLAPDDAYDWVGPIAYS